jgi:hypothetical protein
LSDGDRSSALFPVIMFDRMEPFLPSKVGYSVYTQPGDSNADYKRRLGSESQMGFDLAGLSEVIEYGIWWDWDIEHLYELEAVWVYLGEGDRYLRVEASWHGGYREMVVGDRIPMKDGRPLLFSQPGKHAFAPSPKWFPREERMIRPCTENAGSGGVHVTPLFEGRLRRTPERDRLVREYLRRKAFVPSFDFVKEWVMPPEAFVPWEELHRWIPLRVEEILARLEGGLAP